MLPAGGLMFRPVDGEGLRAYTHGTVLAPMAGYTDSAFRCICRRMGATAAVTEMVAAAGLSRRSVRSCRFLGHLPEERPLGVQLFGKDPADFARAAGLVSGMGFDFIDINVGCPARKVVRSGSGCALLLDVPRLLAILEATVSSTPLPVTVKIRLGWSEEEPVPEALPSMLAERGAAALAVHGRYRSEMFSGEARVPEMAAMAARSPIPFIANGDSTSAGAALSLRERTGAQGLMVGRGALGSPWLFRELRDPPGEPGPLPGELSATVREQLRLMRAYVPEGHVFHVLRGHLVHYVRGFRGASDLRKRAVLVEDDESLDIVLADVEERLHGDGEGEGRR